LIKDLVDAVSKGGNFLLNIGPEASGRIPESMSQRLLEIGQWIDKVHASIFDSVPYWVTSDQDSLRFTANSNGKSIYVFYCASELVSDIEINTPLPIQKQSIIKLMNKPETKVQWQLNEKGNIELKFDISPQEQKDMQIIVFDISTPL
jgi:alpha-L-fucosidase